MKRKYKLSNGKYEVVDFDLQNHSLFNDILLKNKDNQLYLEKYITLLKVIINVFYFLMILISFLLLIKGDIFILFIFLNICFDFIITILTKLKAKQYLLMNIKRSDSFSEYLFIINSSSESNLDKFIVKINDIYLQK